MENAGIFALLADKIEQNNITKKNVTKERKKTKSHQVAGQGPSI